MILNPPKISGRSEGIDLMRGVCALAVLIFAHLIFDRIWFIKMFPRISWLLEGL